MATLGIIAEYNPFHNGHLYHLVESRNRVNAKRVVVVLSPSFLQGVSRQSSISGLEQVWPCQPVSI